MSAEDNKALVRRLTEEVFNQRNFARLDEFYAADYIDHEQTPRPDGTARPMSLAEMKAAMQSPGPLGDVRWEIEDLIAEGDKVVVRQTLHGTHSVSMMGEEPSGKPLALPGLAILRIENGKIKERWGGADIGSIMQQIGMLPR